MSVISDSHHIDGMAAAKDVKMILQQTMDGVENVKLVNDNVKVVDDRVKTIADGEQRPISESAAISYHHYPDCKVAATEVKVALQEAADEVFNMKRSSSIHLHW